MERREKGEKKYERARGLTECHVSNSRSTMCLYLRVLMVLELFTRVRHRSTAAAESFVRTMNGEKPVTIFAVSKYLLSSSHLASVDDQRYVC
jgi:hypothetical protein